MDSGCDGHEATYDYRDEAGTLLFQVVRMPGKRFVQRRPGGQGGWTWSLDGVRRVLYRLPQLQASADGQVFIVEGEKDADRLAGLSLASTTCPGGAGKWRDEYGDVLSGRDVAILPDNDPAGRRHAEHVARSVTQRAVSVKIVHLPDLSEKGDVSDWLDAGHSVEELLSLVGQAGRWEESRGDDMQPPVADDEASTGKPTQAKLIAALALDDVAELFHDERGHPYAVVPVPGGRRVLALRSGEFDRWLRRLAWEQCNLAPSRETVASALGVLSAHATFEGAEHRLHVRVAWHAGRIWLDLDGTRAIDVSPSGYSIVDEPPILFRSFAHQRPLPVPKRGDPWELLEFLNIQDEQQALSLLCYLVAAMVPDIPVAALVLHGVQGSAKSSLLKALRRLLDPACPPIVRSTGGADEFALAAWQNRALFLDNVTRLPDWLSDALCAAVTGDGWSKRTLYTDEDSTVFEFRNVVGLAGINLVAQKPDLLDRSLILELEPVAPAGRRPEAEFWTAFEAAAPCIFGGLLDALSKAMAVQAELQLAALPRMADFARWGAAAAVGLGRRPEDFLTAFQSNVGRQNQAAIDASPVAQCVLALMAGETLYSGTAAEFLAKLEEQAERLRVDMRSKHWPKNPSWASRRLREVDANLLSLGIRVEWERDDRSRSVRISRTASDAVSDVIRVSGAREGSGGAPGDDDNSLRGGSADASFADADGFSSPAGDPTTASDTNDANDSICTTPVTAAQDDSPPSWSEEMRAEYEERVAMITVHGGLPEVEAKRCARQAVMATHWHEGAGR